MLKPFECIDHAGLPAGDFLDFQVLEVPYIVVELFSFRLRELHYSQLPDGLIVFNMQVIVIGRIIEVIEIKQLIAELLEKGIDQPRSIQFKKIIFNRFHRRAP